MKRPLRFTSWLILGLILLAVGYGAVLLRIFLEFPTDGCSLYLDRGGFVVTAVPPDSRLMVGDVIAAVNGRDVRDGMQYPGVWYRFLLDASSTEAVYTVLRGGQPVTLSVPWQPLRLSGMLRGPASLLLIGLSFLLSAGLLLLSRTRDPAAPLLALGFFFEGINLLNNTWMAAGTGLALSTFWFVSPLDLLSFALTFSTVVHALLVFPERSKILHRFPWSPYLLHAINLLLALVGIAAVGWAPLPDVRSTIYRFLYPVAGVELVAGVALLVHSYVTTRRPGVRNQIRWLIWGLAIGALPWLVLSNLPVALGSTPLLPIEITVLALVVVPITFFFSVTRRGLMVVDTLIRRSLVYAVLIVLLGGMYWLGWAGMDRLTRALQGTPDSRVTGLLMVVVVILVANPLRLGLERLAERFLYRPRVDQEKLLREIGERLSTTLQFETIWPLLVREVPAGLGGTQAALLLRQEDGSLQAVEGSPLTFPADHPLVAQLEAGDEALVAGRERFRTGVLAEMAAAGWELALPLRSGGRLVGVYLLGPRQRGDLYSRSEVEALSGLSRQVAATLENARLVRRIELQNQELEAIVRRRTEVLEEERNWLDAILHNMADGLMVTAEDQLIVLTNPALEEMVGLPSADLIGRPVEQALPFPTLAAAITEALVHPGQAQALRLEWEERFFKASITGLPDRCTAIVLLRDVTQETEVDRMKSQFISAVSHELRTPLTSILGFAKLIRRAIVRTVMPALPQQDPAMRAARRVEENLEVIVREATRLTDLVNDVLAIAALDSREVLWRDQPVDLPLLIRQAVDGVREEAAQKGLALEVEIAPGIDPLLVDPEQISRVLSNLLANAIKFTDQGRIFVSAQPLEAGMVVHDWVVPVGGGVQVSVSDTGMGITPEAMGHIFRRFYQGTDARSGKPRGTGLGLAICQEIVGHYGGVIWAESTQGVGSTFHVVLPRSDGSPSGGG